MVKNLLDLQRYILGLQGIEYATADPYGRILSHSPDFSKWVDDEDDCFDGRLITDLFVELSGLEEEISLIAQQEARPIKIEKIYRSQSNGDPAYFTLTVAPYEDGLLVLAADVTIEGCLEQRITQQRNELNLLSNSLSSARTHLDDLLHRFLPNSVADQMIANPKAVRLGGERRTVTVLFADIRGFTNWTEKVAPEKALHMLNDKLGIAVEAIGHYNGTIDKFMGDAVMGVFNAPLPHPDHALHAVRAAWELIQALKDELILQFSIGINTGTAVAGNIGTTQVMNYTVIGDAVNQAKRLQEMAKPGQILISETTYRALRSNVDALNLGNHRLKGRKQETGIYYVTNVI